MSETLLFSPQRVRRMVRRMAYQVVERNAGSTTLVVAGIVEKGVPMAAMLAEAIGAIEGTACPVHALNVTPYRDDQEAPPPADAHPALSADVTGHDVLLVDDVLFTGRTARAAIDAVVRSGRPDSIQLAVLIDRGHREYPIQPDYVGRTIPTKHRERVVVEPSADASFTVRVVESDVA
ncbi:MAG: bifunctional pyr operon transcriptional regulator/uracil phosphoribosyltransferase PyrR [Bacteroidetes bacterium]|jgi:pyrimidine operon attenuation protein/uracil phosphoribosyltransferase|nr:bifunctional pyr operon transcriptional regulator/uracil phosphoribosyltransferase PyrR [Bacteroidota bacterium]